MKNIDIHKIVITQLANNLRCNTSNFEGSDSKVILSNAFGSDCYNFCEMICYKNNIVVSVDERIEEFMKSLVTDKIGFRCFEEMSLLSKEFNRYGKGISMGEAFLPDLNKVSQPKADFDVAVLSGNEITTLYNDNRFHMALGYTTVGTKADVLAVVGYKDKQILGVAGASNDYETMWQVGIDVVPEYRNKGIATILTKLLTYEIINKGIVPFYCTAWSNIASKNTAISSGYKSAWVGITAID